MPGAIDQTRATSGHGGQALSVRSAISCKIRSLDVAIRAFSGNAMRRSRFRKQQSLVVARGMADTHHFEGADAHSVENEVIAERTSADTEMFVARNLRITARRIRQRLTFFPQLLHEIKCDLDALLSYVGFTPFAAPAPKASSPARRAAAARDCGRFAPATARLRAG
jgi:hypothetical protein